IEVGCERVGLAELWLDETRPEHAEGTAGHTGRRRAIAPGEVDLRVAAQGLQTGEICVREVLTQQPDARADRRWRRLQGGDHRRYLGLGLDDLDVLLHALLGFCERGLRLAGICHPRDELFPSRR